MNLARILAQSSSVDPSVIDPSTGLPAGLIYDPETNQWTDASGNLWMPQQMDPNAPPTWTNQTEMANSGNYPNDATARAAQQLGIQDFNGFAARANSGNLTQDDISKIGRLSSVAPQISNGRVTNASDFFSGAVGKSQDIANASNKGKFLGIPMDPGIADALTLGSAYLGGGYALANAPTTGAAGATASGASGGAAAGGGGTLADTLAANAAGGLKVVPEAADLSGAISGASGATGASGVIPGLSTESAGALGSGLSVPGVTGFGSTGAIGAAGAGLGAGLGATLAAGGAAAGSTVPAAVGGVGAGTAAAAAGAGGIGATKLSDVLAGNVGIDDLAKNLTVGDLSRTIGTGLATAGSIAADTARADAQKAMYNQYLALGAPSRDRYEASFAPGFDVNSIPGFTNAINTSADTVLRRLSTSGNPFGDPGGLTQAMNYISGNLALPTLQNYRAQNANTGGYSSFNTAAPSTGAAAIDSGSAAYSDLARGASDIFNPPTDLARFLRQYQGGGGGANARGLT